MLKEASLRRLIRILLITLLAFVIAFMTVWAALALWYRFPAPKPWPIFAAFAFALIGFATIIALYRRFRFTKLVPFCLAFAGLMVWWSMIEPSREAQWAPDVARQVTGRIEGNTLTLTNLRNFEWGGDNRPIVKRWETRNYDLSTLRSLDVFLSYWGGPEMAHVVLSFGFQNGDYLAWSIEVRRREGGEFSPIGDLFKSNPLIIVAADERDVVGVRSGVRGEDVHLYRLKTPPEAAKKLLLEYVADANALAEKPRFYNSITTNCTTTVIHMARAVGDAIPFDWRLIVNGYLPDYIYERGGLDTELPITEVKERARIGMTPIPIWPDFSQRIRVNIPERGQR